ncbi:hypothetical protein D9611_011021 [Ephemerocybe angulata]|uniref:UBC core domain-containing protein n=1 Tax=Ephemerocybe angulata TaxID=980116 RepID=A0A8H5F1E5_9AGAR|nr:hypothetical protein D9611_011021 [Tulosesus angulatus]
MASSHRLLARLQRDLAELREQPYPGVDVFIDDADIRKFCLVLSPPAGPWKGLSLHFDVQLPPSWPSDPPTVSSSVSGIDHPNLFGNWICCDLLKPMSYLETGYTGGYTPALTLRGLFLQFLTFFSSTSVEQDYGGAIEIGDALISSYMQEKDVAAAQYPWERCCRSHGGLCTCKPLHRSQLELEREWRADSRPETTLLVYSSADGTVTHKVKGTTPKATRVHLFEKQNPRWKATLELISTWSCKRCPYGSAEHPHQASQAGGTLTILSNPTNNHHISPDVCVLHLLNDDVLLEIASHMLSETLITFGRAYPRFHALITGHHVFLLRELHCFFLKTPLNEGILGIGVAFEPGPRTLSSDFDWLSLEAFEKHAVRKSIQKRDFEFFLPLAFNQGHFIQARQEIWRRVALIDAAVRQADVGRQANGSSGRGGYGRGRGGPPAPARINASPSPPAQPHHIFNVLFKMMNNIVVSLMQSCDDALVVSKRSSSTPNLLNASEKAVISYCHLMHLLICLCRSHPVVLEDARQRIQTFLQTPANRTKAVTPDMGELIVVITLVLIMTPPNQPTQLSWPKVAGPFLEEAITRNVRWVLKDAPELEVMEEGASDYRLTTTFSRSKTSLRLIMFQITFLNMFIKTYHTIGIQALDQNYGFPESHLPARMVEEIKDLYKVDTWPGFFAKAQYAKSFTKGEFTEMLRAAVAKSRQRGYHLPSRPEQMGRLIRLRKELERARAEAQSRR